MNRRLAAIALEHNETVRQLMNGRNTGTLSIRECSLLVDRIHALREERRELLLEAEERILDEY